MTPVKTTLLIFVCLAFCISCSDDDNPSQPDESEKVIGSYTITALNVSPAQDINGDGTTSTNLLDELSCISGTLDINADTSWNLNVIRINLFSIAGGLFFIDCGDADSSSGNWTFANNQLSLNGGFEPTLYLLSGTTLTREIGEDLPGFQSAVFTRQ